MRQRHRRLGCRASGRTVECLVFIQIKYLQKPPQAAPLCSLSLSKRKLFVCRGSCREPFSVRQANCSQHCEAVCPTVPERTPCVHADGDNVPIILSVVSAEWSYWSKSSKRRSQNFDHALLLLCQQLQGYFSIFSLAFYSYEEVLPI